MNYNYRAKYLPTNDYNKLDVVIFQKTPNDLKQFFMCITSHTHTAPQEPSHNTDTAYWVTLNSNSNFPNSVDMFITRRNYSASDVTNVNRYEELFVKPNRTPAEDDELNSLTNALRDKIISPDDWNKMQSALQNMQMFLKSDVEGYVNQKKAELEIAQANTLNSMEGKKNEFTSFVSAKKNEFDTTLEKFSFQGNYAGTVQYFKWNTVKYNNETYLCLQDGLGNDPTNTTYWAKIAARGQQGEQGLAGLGLVYKATFDNTLTYNIGDCVNWGGSLYYCKVNSPIGTLPSDQDYWTLFLSKQSIPVSPTPPPTPATGEMWLHESDNPIFKYWNGASWIGVGATNADKLGGQLPSYYATAQSVTETSDKISQVVTGHKADYVNHVPYAAAVGSVNTYSASLNPTPSAYVEGMAIAVKINVANTGTSTININNLGAKTIKKANGNDVASGNLKAGSIYTLRYNGTNFILQGEGGSGSAQPSDVLSGRTFTNDAGDQIGTMVNHGTKGVIMPTTVRQSFDAGYYQSFSIEGDADLSPRNIIAGKNIFGVAGQAVVQNVNLGNPAWAQMNYWSVTGNFSNFFVPNKSNDYLYMTRGANVLEKWRRLTGTIQWSSDVGEPINDAVIDSKDNIWVLTNNKIRKYESATTFSEYTIHGGGTQLHIDTNDNLYILGLNGKSISITSVGIKRWEYSSAGSSNIFGSALGSDALYVFTNKAYKIGLNGSLITSNTSESVNLGSSKGVVTKDGSVYISTGISIIKYDKNLTSIVRTSGNDNLKKGSNIVKDTNDNLYVSDESLNNEQLLIALNSDMTRRATLKIPNSTSSKSLGIDSYGYPIIYDNYAIKMFELSWSTVS